MVEGATWHDQFWGDCVCGRPACALPGQNWLGRILMEVRNTLAGHPGNRWVRAALTGHRPKDFTPEQRSWVIATLPAIAERLQRDHGTTVALSGLALGSDTWWARAALLAGLDLWAYVPFAAQPDRWAPDDKAAWSDLRRCAAREVCLGDGYDVRLLHARNHLMVRDADVVIAVHNPERTTGGTAEAIRYARGQGRPLIRLNILERTTTFVRPPD